MIRGAGGRQALVRTGLRMVLEAEPDIEVVGEAADGLQAVEGARLRPDLFLMDIRMPNLDGIEATRRLAGPGVADPVRVLILTTYDVDEYVFAALRAGAVGSAEAHTRLMAVEAVRTWPRATADRPGGTRRLIADSLGPGAPTPPRSGPPHRREREVLDCRRVRPTPRSPATWSAGRPRSSPRGRS